VIPADPPREAPWFRVGDDDVRFLRDGVEAFPVMFAAMAAARTEILVEFYWITPDHVGHRLRDVLVERARAGVAVRVIYDALGSSGMTEAWWRPLLEVGGKVHEYHPITPFRDAFRIERLQQRDHRKLLVIDSSIGFTGGLNMGDAWLSVDQGGGGWRDDVIQVCGPAAHEMRSLFYWTWRRKTREHPPPGVHRLPRPGLRPVYVLASQRRRRRSIHREYVLRMNAALHSIDLAHSYFVPDLSMRSAMRRALARGVRVRVVVPEVSDVPGIQFAVEALFDRMLRAGVEIYALPPPMLHAKTAIFDEKVVLIGSYNLDERSWRKNLEANVAVVDEPFARCVTESFERDVARAKRVVDDVWTRRSIFRRGAEWVALALREIW
jgi:cardiolipin synthase